MRVEIGIRQRELDDGFKDRIVRDPGICDGEAVVQALASRFGRFSPVLPRRDSIAGLLIDFPSLSEDDVRA